MPPTQCFLHTWLTYVSILRSSGPHFMGYIRDYTWSYQGEHDLLVPGFLRADRMTYGGQHKWYPNVPWELRRVVVLEALPKGEHPYSKRVFYFDAQTYALLGLLSYDHQGTFVRMPQC